MMSPNANPYSMPSNENNSLIVSPAPSRLQMDTAPAKSRPRDTQVTVNEQEARIKGLEELVRKQEDQLNQARVTASIRRSEMPVNRNDTMKDVLQDYEKTIAGLKADNLQYKKLDKKVIELEKEKVALEDEVRKSHQVKIALENQLERWQGVEGNIPEMRSKITNLQTDVTRYQNEVKRLRGENDNLSKKLGDSEGKHLQAKRYEEEINKYVLMMRDYEDKISFLKEEKAAIEAGEKGRKANLEIDLEKLRGRNSSLTTELNSIHKEIGQARATISSNSVMNNKIKELEIENNGLKSMLLLNQKTPKNQIFNDDIRPSTGTAMGDVSTMPSTLSQLVLTRIELIRIHEENMQLKKSNRQSESDVLLLKQKLYKRSSKPYSPVGNTNDALMKPTTKTNSNAVPSREFSKKNDNDLSIPYPENDDFESHHSGFGLIQNDRHKSSSPGRSPRNKQVTFELPSSNENQNDRKNNSTSEMFAGKGLTQSDFKPADDKILGNVNKINRSYMNTPGKDNPFERDTLEIKDLGEKVPSSPKFGPDQNTKKSDNKQAKSQFMDNSSKPDTSKQISKSFTYQDFEAKVHKSQEQLLNIDSHELKRSNLSKIIGNPNRISATHFNQGASSRSSVNGMNPGIQESTINKVAVDPYQESYMQGYEQNTNKSQHIQAPRRNGQYGDTQTAQIQQPAGNVAIDPELMSQMMAMLQPQMNQPNNIQRSQTPQTVPIDPMAASQMMAVLSAMQQNQYAKQPMDASNYPQIWNDKSVIGKNNMDASNFTLKNMSKSSSPYMNAPEHYDDRRHDQINISQNNYNPNDGGRSYIQQKPSPLEDYDAALTPYASFLKTQPRNGKTDNLDRFRFGQPTEERSISPSFGAQNHQPQIAQMTSNYIPPPQPQPERLNRVSYTQVPSPRHEPVEEVRLSTQSQAHIAQHYDIPPEHLTRTMQPIHIPEKMFKRNVIFTNDGKQVLIPIGSGSNSARQDSGSMAYTMDQLGAKRYNQTQETNVKRVIDDSALRSQSPKGSRAFMPNLFQSQAPQNTTSARGGYSTSDRMTQSTFRR